MNNTALDYLIHRFVLFSVEGTAEDDADEDAV